MKRYLIFAAIGPFLGGLLLLFASTFASGYWTHTNWAEVGKFFAAFVKTLQFAYLFGIVPALMLGAIDDILLHVRRIGPVVRMLIVGTIGFVAAELLYGSRGPDYRRGAILPLWHRRLCTRDAVVVAGTQICRGAAGGHHDVGRAFRPSLRGALATTQSTFPQAARWMTSLRSQRRRRPGFRRDDAWWKCRGLNISSSFAGRGGVTQLAPCFRVTM